VRLRLSICRTPPAVSAADFLCTAFVLGVVYLRGLCFFLRAQSATAALGQHGAAFEPEQPQPQHPLSNQPRGCVRCDTTPEPPAPQRTRYQ
jgi:hypothetical protein